MKKLLYVILLFILSLYALPSFCYEHSDFELIKQLRKCNKKIDRNPEDVRLYIQRGYLNFMVGNYEDALSDYESAKQLEPENSDIYYSNLP